MVLAVDWAADAIGRVTSVDSYHESIGIDLTQVLERRANYETRHLIGCLGNHPSGAVVGFVGNRQSCPVERDFCHSLVASHHYNHVTIEECPNWIADEQGNHAWDNSEGDLSMTERAAHS